MISTTENRDETSRLVLMDMQKHEGFFIFAHKMREQLPDMTTIDIQYYYQKYRGFDKRMPTHSVETGEPISRR